MRRRTEAIIKTPFAALNGRSAAVARATCALLFAELALAACSGGVANTNTGTSLAGTQFTVGGTVTGLSGANLLLQNNGADNLAVGSDGTFTFPTSLIQGNSYSVSVLSQPSSPSQTCVVTNGIGTIAVGNVSGVTVVCADKTAAKDMIGGTAAGIVGSGLILQNDNGDNLAVASNGAFVFATPLASGIPYAVSVLSPPVNPYQDCAISNGAGTTGASDVTNVTVTCKTNVNPTFTIGGTVSGISGTGTLVLQDNARDNLTLSADGPFQFPLPIPSSSNYDVTSLSVSGQQSQTCAFTNAAGTVANSNVTNVSIVCKANLIVSVTVSNLTGAGLVLQDNGGDNLAVTKNGVTAFATALPSGASYNVTVAAQPSNPSQTCIVSGGVGTVVPGSATAVTVNCSINSFTVGGTITNLSGTGLVLQDNGGNNLAVSASGGFVFTAPLISGTPYQVTVLTQPTAPTQTCVVNGGSGIVTNANVGTVAVVCQTNPYTVGGTVSGLAIGAAAGPILQNNGGDTLPTSNGMFTFPTALLSGTTYDVTVQTQPNGYFCAVAGPTGTVTNADVTNVTVTCALIGGFLHVTNGGDNTISSFVMDQLTGALLPLPGSTATGVQPSSIVLGCSVGNTFDSAVYVANAGSDTLTSYRANAFTGVLTPTNTAVGTGAAPGFVDLAFPTGKCEAIALNTGGSSASAYLADATTGALTAVSGNPFATDSAPTAGTNLILAQDAQRISVEYVLTKGTGQIAAYLVDATTGALALQTNPASGAPNPVATGSSPSSVVFEFVDINATSFGFAYVSNQGANSISAYGLDAFFGLLAPVVDAGGAPILAPTGGGPTSLSTVEGAATYVYVANGTDGTLSGYTIKLTFPNPGTLVPININAVTGGATIATGGNPVSIQQVTLINTTYLYVINQSSNNVSAFSVDLATGALTPVAGSPFASGAGPTSAAVQSLPED